MSHLNKAVETGTSSSPIGSTPDPQLLRNDDEGWDNFDRLLTIQCTLREVAAFFGRSTEWVSDRVQEFKGMNFSQYAATIRPKGVMSLRRKQFEVAMAGDRTMLIWLGKQYLEQSDKNDTRVGNPDGTPLALGAGYDVDPAKLVLEGLAQIRERQQIAQAAASAVESHPLKAVTSGDTSSVEAIDAELVERR